MFAILPGNEACDLDSGVSSLCLAFHRAASQEKAKTRLCGHRSLLVKVVLQLAIPLLNIPSIDFSLKTELVGKLIIHCFSQSSGPKGREDYRSINSWDRWQHWLKKASMSPLSCFETPPRPPSIYQTSLSSWLTTMFLGRGTRLLKVE